MRRAAESRRWPPLAERFWAKTRVDTVSGCLLWTGTTLQPRWGTGFSYGKVRLGGKLMSAHRVAWELTHGQVLDGLMVLHKCDVRNCVNPDHLFLGTHADNMRDMSAKGRGNNASAVRTISAKTKAKTHCPQGHPYDEANTYLRKSGWRSCRRCHANYTRTGSRSSHA